MASGTHQEELDIAIERVWGFVSDMNKWAPLVPGYVEHQILNNKQSTWAFIVDIGFVQKTIFLQIDITEWNKPTKVTFNLSGLNENFIGEGYFKAKAVKEEKTIMIGYLEITAKGMMGPVINPILKSFVPKTTRDFTKAIANTIVELETVIQ